jgi:hypothetical protein
LIKPVYLQASYATLPCASGEVSDWRDTVLKLGEWKIFLSAETPEFEFGLSMDYQDCNNDQAPFVRSWKGHSR